MARMHTRRKGISRSTKPLRKEAPQWVTLSPEDIEKKVVELAKQDKTTSQIGMIMRDTYGVPDIKLSTGKKITRIMEEHGVAPGLPEDISNLIVKALRLRKHIANNNKDRHNKRALNNTEAKVRRLGKYYSRNGVMPADWKYSPDTAERLVIQ